MPGTVVFKPIEANITHNTELIGKMDPYCLFHVGTQKIKGQVCRKGGKHPQWEDSIVIPITNQPTCVVDLKDKDILHDDKIGTFEVDLREVETQGRLKKWYPLFYKEKPAGEILIEAIYAGDSTAGINQGVPSTTNTALVGGSVIPTGIQQETFVSNTVAGQPYIVDQTVGTSYVVNQGTTTTGIIGGGIPTGIIGGGIPTGNIYGSQGMPLQGDSFLPVIGGSFPATHSGIINSGVTSSELYAQEALIRGVDPLNVSSATRFNQASGLGSGLGYPASYPGNQLGGFANPIANSFGQSGIPINTTSQQIPSNFGNRDLVIEEARNL